MSLLAPWDASHATTIAVSRSRLTEKPAVRTVGFGDGYRVDSQQGINSLARQYELDWQALTLADAATLLAFFRERAGWQRITWTPKSESAGQWVCQRYSRQLISGGALANVRATMQERF